MPRVLVRLLESYEFLKNIRRTDGSKLSPSDTVGLQKNIDRVFLDILEHVSSDPRVSIAQTRFLVTNLADSRTDSDQDAALRQACRRHLDRLEAQISAATSLPPGTASSVEYRYFDSLMDRVAVLDAEYRYVFTNTANAQFHGRDVRDFIGLPNWRMVDRRYFEQVSKARFDACLAGQRVSFFTRHPVAGETKVFAANFDPVRAPNGKVREILVISRDVTSLPIPADQIAALP